MSTILLPFLNNLSALTGGVPLDYLRLIINLLANYPAALFYKTIPHDKPNVKHLYSIMMSILARGSFGIIALDHIYRQVNSLTYDQYDTTGPQMVLIIKLTSFAFNVYDGRRPAHELTSYQKLKSVTKMPSILEYLGFVFFFGGFMVGPAFEFMDYRQFTNMEMFRIDNNNDNKAKNNTKKYYVPNGFVPSMGKLLFGLFWVVCTYLLGKKYDTDWILTKEYRSKSLFNRLLFIQISAFCARFKYYIVWLLAEGSCVLSGIGFNGYDGKGNAKWDRVSNINVIAYETADNPKHLLEAWNMNTNKWLKNYVYLRITPPGQKPTFLSTFATFGTSAVWHGFYPGYYLTFASGAFIQSLHRSIRRHIRPIFLTPKFKSYKHIYDFLGWLSTQIMINYLVLPFNILSLEGSLYAWKSVYFCGHLTILLTNMLFWLGLSRYCRKLISIGGGIATTTATTP
ncbi:14917_t:CDS:2, partial [Entrophospora sp. SA101]